MALGLYLGMSLGLIISIMMDNIALGIALGPALGLALGALFEEKGRKGDVKNNVLSCQINKINSGNFLKDLLLILTFSGNSSRTAGFTFI
jgi:hypothetical protein